MEKEGGRKAEQDAVRKENPGPSYWSILEPSKNPLKHQSLIINRMRSVGGNIGTSLFVGSHDTALESRTNDEK